MELDGGAIFVKSNQAFSTHKLHVLSTTEPAAMQTERRSNRC